MVVKGVLLLFFVVLLLNVWVENGFVIFVIIKMSSFIEFVWILFFEFEFEVEDFILNCFKCFNLYDVVNDLINKFKEFVKIVV